MKEADVLLLLALAGLGVEAERELGLVGLVLELVGLGAVNPQDTESND